MISFFFSFSLCGKEDTHDSSSDAAKPQQSPTHDMSLDQLHLLPLAQQEAILNGPAHAPPPGVIPNLDSPPNNNALAVFAASICLVVSTVAFLIGAYAKIFCTKKIHIEDCKSV